VIQDGRLTVRVQGKGNKIRSLPVPKEWEKSLRAWLELRDREPGQGEGPVFVAVSANGTPGTEALKSSGIFTLVRLYGEDAGIAPGRGPHALSPHDLRRTMARNAYDRTGDLLRIQHWLGHESQMTTAGYIGIHDATNNPAGDAVDYG